MENSPHFKVDLSCSDHMEKIKATYRNSTKVTYKAPSGGKTDCFIEPSIYMRITCETYPCVGYFTCNFPNQDIKENQEANA